MGRVWHFCDAVFAYKDMCMCEELHVYQKICTRSLSLCAVCVCPPLKHSSTGHERVRRVVVCVPVCDSKVRQHLDLDDVANNKFSLVSLNPLQKYEY